MVKVRGQRPPGTYSGCTVTARGEEEAVSKGALTGQGRKCEDEEVQGEKIQEPVARALTLHKSRGGCWTFLKGSDTNAETRAEGWGCGQCSRERKCMGLSRGSAVPSAI